MTIRPTRPNLTGACKDATSDGRSANMTSSGVMAERPKPADDMGCVVRFTPRTALRRPVAPQEPSPIGDIGQYARAGDEDDYRHRMTMNVLAFVICLLLAAAGIWLANRLAEMRRTQDCVLSGRLSCTQVDMPPRER